MSFHVAVLPEIRMYPLLDVDFFLFGQKGIFCGITHRKQTGKFVVFRSTDNLLNFFHFVGNGNVEYSSQSFNGGGMVHIFQYAPCRSEVVERALLLGLEQRTLFLAEEGQD